jgi:hypothetical protein
MSHIHHGVPGGVTNAAPAAVNPLHASINEGLERLGNVEAGLATTLALLYNSRPVAVPVATPPSAQPSSPGDSLETKLDRLLYQISAIETQVRELART